MRIGVQAVPPACKATDLHSIFIGLFLPNLKTDLFDSATIAWFH